MVVLSVLAYQLSGTICPRPLPDKCKRPGTSGVGVRIVYYPRADDHRAASFILETVVEGAPNCPATGSPITLCGPIVLWFYGYTASLGHDFMTSGLFHGVYYVLAFFGFSGIFRDFPDFFAHRPLPLGEFRPRIGRNVCSCLLLLACQEFFPTLLVKQLSDACILLSVSLYLYPYICIPIPLSFVPRAHGSSGLQVVRARSCRACRP